MPTVFKKRSCNQWYSSHTHIPFYAQKFSPLDWSGTIGIQTKQSNEHELETDYKLLKNKTNSMKS